MEDAIGNERYVYENMFGPEGPFFTPSAFFASDTNSHDDLDNILRGNFLNQLDSFGRISTGSGSDAWGAQGTSYSPYPDLAYTSGIQANQELWGTEFANAMAVSEKIPEINGVQYSEDQTRVDDTLYPALISENGLQGELSTKREPDTTLDAARPKPKKKRGLRKRKEISAAEKKAKEEKKLERNRLAAGKCREKKKQENARRIEEFNELEHQNQFLKASIN